MRLSIVIPVFNERDTVLQVLERVRQVPLPATVELVVVDDGSTDGTADVLAELPPADDLQVILAEENQGKGMAVRRGIERATGDYIVFQDADLELDPRDLALLVAPVADGRAEVVFGSRFLGKPPLWSSLNYWANRVLTLLTNLLFGGRITDMETCYKLFPAGLLKSYRLVSCRFEIEPELTAKTLRLGHRIHEVPIHYFPRTVLEGKKMRWRDGVTAVRMLLGQRFAARSGLTAGAAPPAHESVASGSSESSRNG